MKKFSSPHISYRLVLFDVEVCLHQLDELTTCLVHSPPILTCRAFLYHSKAILTSDHKNACIWRCIYQENKNLSSSKDNISSVGIISIEIFVNKMVYLFKSNFWAWRCLWLININIHLTSEPQDQCLHDSRRLREDSESASSSTELCLLCLHLFHILVFYTGFCLNKAFLKTIV